MGRHRHALRLPLLFALTLPVACHHRLPPTSPAAPRSLPAQIDISSLPPPGTLRQLLVRDLRRQLHRHQSLIRLRAAQARLLARTTPPEFPLHLELDAQILGAPDPGRALSRRYLQRAFALHGIVLGSGYLERLLDRWMVFASPHKLRAALANAVASGGPLLYRGQRLPEAFRIYSELLRDDARRLEEGFLRVKNEHYVEQAIKSFYLAQYNALIQVLVSIGDLPVAPLNLFRTLEGREHIPGLGHWLAACREHTGVDASGRPRSGVERSWSEPCVLKTLPYEGEYGEKYGPSLETGALLGMMTPASGTLLEGVLARTLGPGVRWLSTRAGEAGAQLVWMMAWWLERGGQAFAVEAAIDVKRSLGVLFRGGERLADGTWRPLGPGDAMALLERILVQIAVAKNVKGIFEKHRELGTEEERREIATELVLWSRFPPTKPQLTPEARARWLEPFERKPSLRGTPAYDYEIRHTGPENILVKGGGEQIWADGVGLDGILQEAKYVDKPESSPFVPESSCPPEVRDKILDPVEKELKRYTAIIHDPRTPAWGLEIITNHPSAAAFLLQRLEYYRLPGRVVVRT